MLGCFVVATAVLAGATRPAPAQVVPGTGRKLDKVGDDFEDAEWKYLPNLPKSSEEQDKQVRAPGGVSANGRWFEPGKRGQPDMVRRVETPEGGLAGSQGALLLRSCYTGIPGRPSGRPQQDDFSCDIASRIGGPISVSSTPSIVVRVYLPP